jgi:hypothetical protein
VTVPTQQTSETRRQHVTAAIVILFLSFSFFLIQYDRLRSAEPMLEIWYQQKVAGTLPFGDQYRIAIPFAAHFLKSHVRLEMRQTIPLIESACYGGGLTALYLLLLTSPIFAAATRAKQLAMLGLFFATVQFPILWIFPWERPETLPTMFYLAVVSLIVLSRRLPLLPACRLAVLASFAQAFARTDAPMLFGLALLAAAAIGFSMPRSRRSVALVGLLCGATGAAVHLYLAHRFPRVSPNQRATDMNLLRNFNPLVAPIHVPIFFIALLPFFFSLVLMRRYRIPLDSTDKLTLLIALLYLPIYITFGVLAEVRIYVPYLFLLAPLFAKLWIRFLSGERMPRGQMEIDAASTTTV